MNHKKLIGAAMMSGLGLWTAAMPARASTVTEFGEQVQVFTNSATLGLVAAQVTYANVAFGNFASAPGISTTGTNDPNAILNFSPNPALLSGGATSASVSAVGTAGSADSSASLSSGATHLEANTAENPTESSAGVIIEMQDGLTFHVAGGGSANVTLTYTLDGSLTYQNSGSYSQLIEYYMGSADMIWNAADDYTGGSAQNATENTGGFNSFIFTNNTPSGFQFQGTFTVTDGEALQLFYSQSMSCAGGANCDFENTGQMGLSLPTGTSFTSDSGLFLTQTEGTSAPEPGSLLLMGLGMSAIGYIGRRRLTR